MGLYGAANENNFKRVMLIHNISPFSKYFPHHAWKCIYKICVMIKNYWHFLWSWEQFVHDFAAKMPNFCIFVMIMFMFMSI